MRIEITVLEHTFLDCSKGWFVKINGVQSGGEIHSRYEAEETAKSLTKELGGIYKGINSTNELP